MWGTCSSGETSQKLQLCGSLPSQGRGPSPRQGTPDTGPEVTWEDIGTQGDPSHTHTASSMSVAAVPNASLESAREREGLLSPKMIRGRTWVGWKQAEASHGSERLWGFWRGSRVQKARQ